MAAVILVAAHWTEQREFALLLRRSAPEWLLLAALPQAATYLARAAVWKTVLVRVRARAPLWELFSDVPAIGLAGDSVDPELMDRPRRWNMRLIRRFMVSFGLLSSLFDFLAFGALLRVFQASPALFRTGWFIESLLTELVIALVVRTLRPFYRSRPGLLLLVSTVAIAGLTLLIPFFPFAGELGFVQQAKKGFFQKEG
jgi:Mg2+-importing ATPase